MPNPYKKVNRRLQPSLSQEVSVKDCLLCQKMDQCRDEQLEDIDLITKENTKMNEQMSSTKSEKAGPVGIKSVTISEAVLSPRARPNNQKALSEYDIDAEIAKKNAEEMDDMSVDGNMDLEQNSVLRGKANTPASMFTEFTELRDMAESRTSPQPSHVTGNTRDVVYQQAITLMTERCVSSNQAAHELPLVAHYNPPIGTPAPQYFFINQKKPTPMQPLKAWRGYHGNVYFEPIQISSASISPAPVSTTPDTKSRKASAKSTCYSRSSTSLSKQSGSNSKSKSNPQMVILDKQTVLNRINNGKMNADLMQMLGQESTGSLRMEPSPGKAGKQAYNKDKICRGSTAKSRTNKNKTFPFLSVSGDKFINATVTQSPLLRSQTQYSQSSQRMTMNSPSPEYYATFSNSSSGSLPPLEQLKASLKRMDHKMVNNQVVHMVPPADRMKYEDPQNIKGKPYVRYSAEIRKSSAKQQKVI